MSENLSITLTPFTGGLVASAQGRIDSSTAALFEEELQAAMAQEPQALIVDLAQVEYMSSAALRVLLMITKRCKGEHRRMILCAMSPGIREVFDISGFSAIFDIAESVEAARQKAQS